MYFYFKFFKRDMDSGFAKHAIVLTLLIQLCKDSPIRFAPSLDVRVLRAP